MRGGGVDNIQENDHSIGYVNSSGDGCDFGRDNGGGEKEMMVFIMMTMIIVVMMMMAR